LELSTAKEGLPGKNIPADHSLFDVYHRSFEILRADTPDLLEAAHRLRYQVFCVENHIFSIDDNPGEWERDVYDSHSIQAVLRHRATNAIAGTVRLVLPPVDVPFGCLPIYNVCPDMLRRPDLVPIERTAELGRFAISKDFRRRAGDGLYGRFNDAEALRADLRRVIPHMSLGLISAALQFGRENGIDYCCVVMEPSLLRLLTRFGIHFTPFGPPVEYHGLRQPCCAEVTPLVARVEREHREVWQVLTENGRFWPATLPAQDALEIL
jgi:N-acyl amino acid synthase of PEP-CTERM/exosortase system